jgi:hypothetical protein
VITFNVVAGISAACIAFTVTACLVLKRFDGSYQPAHKTPRREAPPRAGAVRAGRRLLGAARRLPVTAARACRRAASPARLPGAIRRRLARDLSAYDRTTLALIGQMRYEDTGGLLALPAPGTTVKIRAADTRAAVRTMQAGPALYGPGIWGPLPELPPDGLDASCTYQPAWPLASMLSDETLARGITAVT